MKLKYQFTLLLKRQEFWITFLLMLLFSIAGFVASCIAFYGKDLSMLISGDQLFIGLSTNSFATVLQLMLPLIVGLPFCDSTFVEKQSGSLQIILPRFGSAKKYYLSKAIVAFASAFFVVFVPLLLNILLNTITFPATSLRDFTNFASNDAWQHSEFVRELALFPSLLVRHPQLYNIVANFLLACFSGMASVFVYACSFFIKKYRILVMAIFFFVYQGISLLSWTTGSKGFNIAFYDYFFAYSPNPGRSPLNLILLLVAFAGVIAFMAYKGIRKLENAL